MWTESLFCFPSFCGTRSDPKFLCFLHQHQQQVLGAIERAKQVTAPELNSIIRVRDARLVWVGRGGNLNTELGCGFLTWGHQGTPALALLLQWDQAARLAQG